MKRAGYATLALLLFAAAPSARAEDAAPSLPTPPSWSTLADLHPGTEVTLTVGGAGYWVRYLVASSDSDITLLNLREPWLPPNARDALRHLATYEPAYLVNQGRKDFVHKNVRVTSDAVYVSGKKAVDLSRIIETFARDDVEEVKYAPRTTAGQVYGMLLGGLTGTIGGAVLGHRQFEHYKPAGTLLCSVSGYFFGVAIGRGIASIFDRPSPRGLIYKRPPTRPTRPT